MEEGPIQPGLVAFICVHTARFEEPILRVTHDEPVDDQDSGWCFSCGRGGHSDDEWLMVLPNRYFAADPSLRDVLTMPFGHSADRQRPDQPWEMQQLEE